MKKYSDLNEAMTGLTRISSTVNQVIEFITQNIRQPANTYIKIIYIESADSLPKTYDVLMSGHDIYFPPNNNNSGAISAAPESQDRQITAEQLFADLRAAVQNTAEWGDQPLKIKLQQNDTHALDCYLTMDDRSNVIYFVCLHDANVASLDDINDFIENTTDLVNELNNTANTDNESIDRAIGHIDDDFIEEHPRAYQNLLAFIPERYHDDIIHRYHINAGNNAGDNETHEEQPEQEHTDNAPGLANQLIADRHEPDSAEHIRASDMFIREFRSLPGPRRADIINAWSDHEKRDLYNALTDDDKARFIANIPTHLRNVFTDIIATANNTEQLVNNEENNDADNNTEDQDNGQEDGPDGDATPVNGFRILGDFDPATMQRTSDEYALLLSPLSLQDVITQINNIPQNVTRLILNYADNKPLRYMHINPGQVTGRRDKKGRLNDLYDQVYRNYVTSSFYIVNGASNITWKQTRASDGSYQIVNMTDLRSDLLEKMLTTGNDWVKLFYNSTASHSYAGRRHILYDPNGYFGQAVGNQTTGNQAAGTNQQAQTQASPQMSRKRYEHMKIAEQVLDRLMNEVVNRYRIRFNIRSKADPSKYYWDGGGRRDHGVGANRGRMLGKVAAEVMARHYDDIDITYINKDGSNLYTANSDRRIIDILRDIFNIGNYKIPAYKQPPPQLSQEDQTKLKEIMDFANGQLVKTGIEIQIVYPGRIPDYEFIADKSIDQGKGFPADKNMHLAVMFSGMLEDKLIGDQAVQFLTETGLINTVKPVLDQADKVYKGITPVICMDNGIK